MSSVTEPPAAPAKKQLWLSASRINTFLFCSQQYLAKYHWKIPDSSNDGAKRGSTVHETLELLLKPRHRHYHAKALKAGTCTKVPALWRLIQRFARKHGVADPENLRTIDGFMLVALRWEFYGPPETKEILGEKKFDINVDDPTWGLRYAVRGSMDKTFVLDNGKSRSLMGLDYKTSKQKPSAAKMEDDIQSQTYQLALRHLYPDIKDRRLDYLYLKYTRAPLLETQPMTEAQLFGFEVRLTDIQAAMEAYTLANAGDNLAAYDETKNRLCGVPDAVKDDGSPRWCCPAHKPMDYWVITDETGEIASLKDGPGKGRAASATTREELEPFVDTAKGQRIEARHYPGCQAFWRDGKRIN